MSRVRRNYPPIEQIASFRLADQTTIAHGFPELNSITGRIELSCTLRGRDGTYIVKDGSGRVHGLGAGENMRLNTSFFQMLSEVRDYLPEASPNIHRNHLLELIYEGIDCYAVGTGEINVRMADRMGKCSKFFPGSVADFSF